MASTCAAEGSDWIVRKISPWRVWSGIGMGCSGRWWNPHPSIQKDVDVALEDIG